MRDVFDLGDSLILVATDRISAFDVVFREEIPEKGKILNRISLLWFQYFSEISNPILEIDFRKFPPPYNEEGYLEGRSVLMRKCRRIDYECVVRGYLSGSAYLEYSQTGKIAGIPYSPGMQESAPFPEPIFTPARKNDKGHDENIAESTMEEEIGVDLFTDLKHKSISIYTKAHEILKRHGILLADTKLEFGTLEGKVYLIDELLTPDSSRFWKLETYKIGFSPPSMDKQILRNYLLNLGWDKNPPPPVLPPEICEEISTQYKELEKKVIECLLQK